MELFNLFRNTRGREGSLHCPEGISKPQNSAGPLKHMNLATNMIRETVEWL
jgi:hypothetical protein